MATLFQSSSRSRGVITLMFGALLAGTVSSVGIGFSAVGMARPPASPLAIARCPAQIETTQTATATDGWTIDRSATAKPLAEIGFFDGPVSDRVQLAPSSETKLSGRSTATWVFSPSQALRIACLYRGTDIVLNRPLPPGVRQCSVTSAVANPVIRPESLVCS